MNDKSSTTREAVMESEGEHPLQKCLNCYDVRECPQYRPASKYRGKDEG